MEKKREEEIERIEEEIIREVNKKMSNPEEIERVREEISKESNEEILNHENEEIIGEKEGAEESSVDRIEIESEEESIPAGDEKVEMIALDVDSVGGVRGADDIEEPNEMESIDDFEKEYQKSFKDIEDSARGKKGGAEGKVGSKEIKSGGGSRVKGKKKKALIVYYSQTRRTETAAFKILATLCRKRNEDPDNELASIRRQIEEQGANVRKIESNAADIIRVENLEDHGFLENAVNGFLKKKYRITVPHVNYNDYDLVFIGCPVWGGKPASPMMAYLASPSVKKKLRGKNVAPFVTCWLSVGGKAALGGMNHLLSDVKCDVIGGAAIDSLETHLGKKELTRVRQFCLVALKMATS